MGRIRDALPGGDEWAHGPVMGTVNVAGAVFCAGAVGHVADVAPLWATGGGGAAALAAAIAARRADLSAVSVVYRACCWAAAGGWTARALTTSPWETTNAGLLVCGALVGGLLAPALARRERREADRAARRLIVTQRQARAVEWSERIDQVCHVRGTQVVGIQTWDPVDDGAGGTVEPGFTVDVRLPRGGVTPEDIRRVAGSLAVDADLPEGCGVEVRKGSRRSRVLLDVRMVNMLGREIPYPTDYPLGSCLRPYSLGARPSGQPVTIQTRERSALVVGSKGSGKSNILNVIIARNVEMVDELVWVIDLSGGRLIVPWMRAWLEKRADRPPLDWVASTVEEALEMCDALIRIGRGRGTAYRDLMHAADADLLPVSARLPQITLITDETKSITGANVTDSARIKLAARLLTVQEELRAMAANTVRASLRPTGDALGGIDARIQSDVLIMMQPKTEEIPKLYDNAVGIKAEDAPYKGNGLLSQDSERPGPFMAYRLSPASIDRLAVAVSDRRPGLDAPSARLAGETYARRWDPDRIAWLLTQAEATVSVGSGGSSPTPSDPGGSEEGGEGMELGEALGRMEATAGRMRADRQRDELDATLTEDEVDRRFADLAAGWEPGAEPAGPDGADTAGARRRMLEILHTAGPAGMTVTALWEALAAAGVDRTRQAVSDWLRIAVAARQAIQPAARGPYIHADHAPRGGDGA